MQRRVLLAPQVLAAVFVLLAVGAGVQRVMLGPSVEDGRVYTHYNNYVVFRDSFTHLRHGQDLYVLYPDEHWDLYKYSPTFAVLMAPFAALPDSAGLVAWDVLGAMLLFLGLWRLPIGSESARMTMAWFLALPLLQSIQNSQSNAHVAGLVLLAAVWLEAAHLWSAALAIALGFFVKIYGGLAVVLVLLHPTRLRSLGWIAFWGVALALLPLAFVPLSQLVFLYQSWGRLLANDQAAYTGVSVMGWLQTWFGLAPPKLGVAVAGLGVTLLPLARVRAYEALPFRMLLLSALLLWMVIFNHKAEPNTFVIAVTGVAVWYLCAPRSWLRVTLVLLVLVFTCLSTTSVFPTVVRHALIQPYSMRVVPCILVWLMAVVEVWATDATGSSQRPPVRSPSTP